MARCSLGNGVGCTGEKTVTGAARFRAVAMATEGRAGPMASSLNMSSNVIVSSSWAAAGVAGAGLEGGVGDGKDDGDGGDGGDGGKTGEAKKSMGADATASEGKEKLASNSFFGSTVAFQSSGKTPVDAEIGLDGIEVVGASNGVEKKSSSTFSEEPAKEKEFDRINCDASSFVGASNPSQFLSAEGRCCPLPICSSRDSSEQVLSEVSKSVDAESMSIS